MAGDGSGSAGAMRSDLYADLYHKELGHWWHRGKRWMLNKVIRILVERHFKRSVVVDLGCGTGALVHEIDRYACGIGVDAAPEALEFCRKRGVRRLCAADIEKPHLPFRDSTVDVVVLADCLEHSRDDVALLHEASRVLVNEGALVILVPAYRWLWSYWDVILGHRRRYTRSSLRRTASAAGLVVVRHTYMLMFLLPIAIMWRGTRQLWFRNDPMRAGSDFVRLPGFLNELFFCFYRWENILAEHMRLPFGLSLMAVCRKTLSGCRP